MALPIFFADYVQSQIVAAANASQTTILIAVPTEPLPDLSAEGAYTYCTFVDQASFLIDKVPPVQREVMKVTAWTPVSSGIQLTVVRGITTTPQIWAMSSIMELRACDQALEDLKDEGTAIQATYVTMTTNAQLDNERVLTAGSGITITDGGAGSTVTIASTGSFVQAQYVTMALDSGLTSERVLTARANITITDNGANGTVVIAAAGGGGTLQSEEFTSDDDFTVPSGVTAVWVTAIGGGAGGGGNAVASTSGHNGGGSGELLQNIMIPVVPSDVMPVVIGAGGTGGAGGSVSAGGAGGNTTFGGLIALGAPATGTTVVGGTGGGVRGGVGSASASDNSFVGLTGTLESVGYF